MDDGKPQGEEEDGRNERAALPDPFRGVLNDRIAMQRLGQMLEMLTGSLGARTVRISRGRRSLDARFNGRITYARVHALE